MIIRQQTRHIFIINGHKINAAPLNHHMIPLVCAMTEYLRVNNPELTRPQIARHVQFWTEKHQKLLWRAHWHSHIRKKITGFPKYFKITLL